MDALALVLQPQPLLVLLDHLFHEVGLKDDLLLSGLRGSQAQLYLVPCEEFLQFSSFYLITDVGFLGAEAAVLEVYGGYGPEVALF